MNALTSKEDIWKLICQHVAPSSVVFIKKNNTCCRIKFVEHEYADIVRKNLDGNYKIVVHFSSCYLFVVNQNMLCYVYIMFIYANYRSFFRGFILSFSLVYLFKN